MHDCMLGSLSPGADVTGGSDGGEVSGNDVQEGGSASKEGDSGPEELIFPPWTLSMGRLRAGRQSLFRSNWIRCGFAVVLGDSRSAN